MILILFLFGWEEWKVMLSRMKKVNIFNGESSMVGSYEKKIKFG
jgi:hypothetical protein